MFSKSAHADNLKTTKMALRELSILSTLRDAPNIIKLRDAFFSTNDGSLSSELYLVLELANEDLYKLIRKPVTINSLQMKSFCCQLFTGVKYV